MGTAIEVQELNNVPGGLDDDEGDAAMEKSAAEHPALPDPQQASLARLQELQNQVRKNDLRSLEARWEFGTQVIKDGRSQATIASAVGVSKQEVNNRKLLAEKYKKTDLSNALDDHRSWYHICKEVLGHRGDNKKKEEPLPYPVYDLFQGCERFHKVLTRATELVKAGGELADPKWCSMFPAKLAPVREAIAALENEFAQAAVKLDTAA